MLHHYYYGPGYGMPGDSGLGIVLATLIPILFWVLVIILIVSLLRRGHFHHWHEGSHGAHQDPIELAKARYAKGDITKAELDEIKKNLKD